MPLNMDPPILNIICLYRCVNKFCDPKSVGEASVSDLMICAPWDTEMFACLADGKDHSPCCAAKQIPPICQVKGESHETSSLKT
jgi:hypothetical protein